MRVTILGAGTVIPAPQRSPAGLYVRAGREHLLFDAGPGTLQRLRKLGITFLDVDRIFFTHFHIDHCLDLASVLFAARIPISPRTKPLSIYGPPGLKRVYHGLTQAFPRQIGPRGYRLVLRELGEECLRLPGYAVRSRWMRHRVPALGFRVTERGRAFAYSGDTDVCPGVVAAGRGADLLILECSVPDDQKIPGHLTPSECGAIAAASGCRHLVLTHFYPVFRRCDIRRHVRRAFRGRLTIARDFTSLRCPS